MQEKMNRKCISACSFYAILNDGTISSKNEVKWVLLQGLFDKKVFQILRNLSVLSIIDLLQSILLQKNVIHKVQIISRK